jgi:uncharacterized integral membrane protein (TIGR00698 family)
MQVGDVQSLWCMAETPPRTFRAAAELLPGLAAVAVAVTLALLVNRAFPGLSALMVALVLGALLTNLGLRSPAHLPGFAFASRWPLRAGVVLLGLQLAVPQVLALGRGLIAVVVLSVVLTFVGANWLGRRLGLSPARSLMVATGFAICGASAVAAMKAVADGDEEDATSAVTLVTIFGSLSVLMMPALRRPLGLTSAEFGLWAGASVHEVAQVVAVASTGGAGALTAAVVVKLTRVVLLAPLITAVAVWHRRLSRGAVGDNGRRPPLVPLFVVGFLAAACARSLGLIPAPYLSVAAGAQTALLAAGMFGLGTSVRLRPLLRTGGRALSLGLLATLLIATVSYTGIAVFA